MQVRPHAEKGEHSAKELSDPAGCDHRIEVRLEMPRFEHTFMQYADNMNFTCADAIEHKMLLNAELIITLLDIIARKTNARIIGIPAIRSS